MKGFLKLLAHGAAGGAIAGVAPIVTSYIPMIPHIDPGTAMILGSIASSAMSALMDKVKLREDLGK